MEVRALGRSGIELSRIVLGCGNFGGIGSSPAFFGAGESEGEAHALMDAAWTAGITAFDTADAYGGGRSESYIGSWLRTKGADVRERLVLTTKTFNPMAAGAGHGLAPDRIRTQIEGSLSRLGVEAVDVYLAHEQDPDTPLEQTIAAFAELQRAGTIKTYGGSNVDRAWLDEALRHRQQPLDVLLREHQQGHAKSSVIVSRSTVDRRSSSASSAGARCSVRRGPITTAVTWGWESTQASASAAGVVPCPRACSSNASRAANVRSFRRWV